MTNQLSTRTISELSGQLRSGELSSTELVQHFLDRIESLNPTLKAFNTVTGEQALEKAQTVDADIAAGNYQGPLHGIPIGLDAPVGMGGGSQGKGPLDTGPKPVAAALL